MHPTLLLLFYKKYLIIIQHKYSTTTKYNYLDGITVKQTLELYSVYTESTTWEVFEEAAHISRPILYLQYK